MRIECTTTFLDGRERFEVGDTFTVSDEQATYFISHGWAKKVGDETPALPSQDITLDIHNVREGQESSNG